MVNQTSEAVCDSPVINRVEHIDSSILQRIGEKTKPIEADREENDKLVNERVWSLPGFVAGARVQTSFGSVPVEALRVGDPIKTRAGSLLKVVYADKIRLDRRFLLTHPEAQPIAIPKDAFGANCPGKNICVSGAQEVWQSDRFDQSQGTAAVKLIGQRHIYRDLRGCVDYFVFHCIEPCTVCIDGLWVNVKP